MTWRPVAESFVCETVQFACLGDGRLPAQHSPDASWPGERTAPALRGEEHVGAQIELHLEDLPRRIDDAVGEAVKLTTRSDRTRMSKSVEQGLVTVVGKYERDRQNDISGGAEARLPRQSRIEFFDSRQKFVVSSMAVEANEAN